LALSVSFLPNEVLTMSSPNPYVSNSLEGFTVFASPSPPDFLAKVKYVDKRVLRKTALIGIDVLRMTTTMNAAGAAGAHGIYLAEKPVTGDYDLTAPINKDHRWVFGGELNGLPIPGAQLDNSPLSMHSSALQGKLIKFYSTNGAKTQATALDVGAPTFFLMSMANIEATVATILLQGFQSVWFLCAGFYNSSCLEDTVCAGIAIQHLLDLGVAVNTQLDDGAKIARNTAECYRGRSDLLVKDLHDSQVAKLLCNIGHCADVAACITGEGMPTDLWNRMTHTVIQLQRSDNGTPLLVPTTV